ncbi:hypothetical protein V9K67_04805 [Paraflavisolibacter sp. H34]|uniref:hypothetical protein n=1 Tax=Huijunlia imazamoxiresistens TaxID=3127457 RepID=UPI00301A16F0
MKLIFFAFLLAASFGAQGQYYYTDIIGTRETAALLKNYKAQKVRKVTLKSYDANDTRSEDFLVEQTFQGGTLSTFTRSGATGGSTLLSTVDDNGNVVRTVDSSETSTTTTVYNYDASGRLTSLVSSGSDTSKAFAQTEERQWQYSGDKPLRMLRIRNRKDTTIVDFRLDERGNVIEEQSTRRGVKATPVQYYYDAKDRLTDIVRYSNKARRLLPEYMFEYSPSNQVIQKITVPANSSDYLIWRYQYDQRGLKIKEAIFNKKKQLTGKIEYQYQFES